MAYKACGNCKKYIPSENHFLHEAHCMRNLAQCSKCKQFIPKLKLAEHESESHGSQSRTSRNMSVINPERLCRMNNSINRLIECQFCQLEVPFDTFDEHVLHCGSRTEICRSCRKFVMIKDRPSHVCISLLNKDSSAEKLEHDFSVALRLQYEEFSKTQEEPELRSERIITMPPSDSYQRFATKSSSIDLLKKDDSESQIPCQFCERLFHLNEIIQHQTHCLLDQSHINLDGEPVLCNKGTEIRLDQTIQDRVISIPASPNMNSQTQDFQDVCIPIRPRPTNSVLCGISKEMWTSTHDENDGCGDDGGVNGDDDDDDDDDASSLVIKNRTVIARAAPAETLRPVHVVKSPQQPKIIATSSKSPNNLSTPSNLRRNTKPQSSRPSYELPPVRDTKASHRGRGRCQPVCGQNGTTFITIPNPTHIQSPQTNSMKNRHPTSTILTRPLGKRVPSNPTTVISVGKRSSGGPNSLPKSPFS